MRAELPESRSATSAVNGIRCENGLVRPAVSKSGSSPVSRCVVKAGLLQLGQRAGGTRN